VLGTVERHNAYPGGSDLQYRGGWAMDADDLYAQAGVGPTDMDLVQVYDDYPVISAMQLWRTSASVPSGEAQAFIRAQHLHERRHAAAQHVGRRSYRSVRPAPRVATWDGPRRSGSWWTNR
jgi:hypothetical protein